MKNIRIGSRESRLAVVQSEMVMDYIKENCQEYTPQLVTMKTTGDRILDRTLDQIGNILARRQNPLGQQQVEK